MRIFSLVREHQKLKVVEIEFCLLPGLPQIHYLGLPDQLIRESILRIKAAMRSQQYQFPRAQQIIVNIRPTYIKKSSRGIDLAVALGILKLTGQVELQGFSSLLVYGELGLDGQVYEPEDFQSWRVESSDLDLTHGLSVEEFKSLPVLTGSRRSVGVGNSLNIALSRVYRISELSETENPKMERASVEGENPVGPLNSYRLQRDPSALMSFYTDEQAKVIALAVLGRHHSLLAGATGTGKSYVGRSLGAFYPDPSIQILQNEVAETLARVGWWPFIAPHHSITHLSMIGGGNPVVGGEVVRAHTGILFLDELLEFNGSCLESLREPMEEQVLRLARGHQVKEFLTSIQVVATTNLCRCGHCSPGSSFSHCRCGGRQRRQYLSRLSGPLLDRFTVLHLFNNRRQIPSRSGQQILREIEEVWTWKRELANETTGVRAWLGLDQYHLMEKKFKIPTVETSLRRRRGIFEVARIVACLNYSAEIKQIHVEESLEYSWIPFRKIQEMGE